MFRSALAVQASLADPVLWPILQQPPGVDGTFGPKSKALLEGRVRGGGCQVALTPKVLLDVLQRGPARLLEAFNGPSQQFVPIHAAEITTWSSRPLGGLGEGARPDGSESARVVWVLVGGQALVGNSEHGAILHTELQLL